MCQTNEKVHFRRQLDDARRVVEKTSELNRGVTRPWAAKRSIHAESPAIATASHPFAQGLLPRRER